MSASKLPDIRAVMLGCGNMGEAILSRLLAAAVLDASQFSVAERSAERQAYLSETYGIRTGGAERAAEGANLLIVAVKPQQFDDLPPAALPPGAVVMSVMAGKPLSALRQRFPGANIVRVMPNLGFKTGGGVTGFYFDPESQWTPEQKDLVGQVLAAGGLTVETAGEAQLDSLTAVSGSGPAYFYWFGEKLAEAAAAAGFSSEQARAMARQTLIGAAELLKASPQQAMADLRHNVTSKGGTTEAALAVLSESDVSDIILKAVRAAQERGKQL